MENKSQQWWDSLNPEEQTHFEKEYGIHGHDIGTTEDDIEGMYKMFVQEPEFERQERELARAQERNEKWDKLMEDFSNLVNNFSHKDHAAGFIQAFGKQHRTLQQSMMRVMFANIEHCATPEYHTDGRNEQTQKACQIMMDAYKEKMLSIYEGAKPSQSLGSI